MTISQKLKGISIIMGNFNFLQSHPTRKGNEDHLINSNGIVKKPLTVKRAILNRCDALFYEFKILQTQKSRDKNNLGFFVS